MKNSNFAPPNPPVPDDYPIFSQNYPQLLSHIYPQLATVPHDVPIFGCQYQAPQSKAAKARLLNELVGFDGGCLRDREVPFLLPQNWRLDWFKGTS